MPWGLQMTALLVATTAATAALSIIALAFQRRSRGAPAAPGEAPLLLVVPDVSAPADPARARASRAALAGRWSAARSLSAAGAPPEEIAARLGIPAGRVEAALGLIDAFPAPPDRTAAFPTNPVPIATMTDRS